MLLLSLLALTPQHALFAATPFEHTAFKKGKNALCATFTERHPSKSDQTGTYTILGQKITINWSHCASIAGVAIGGTVIGKEYSKESDKRAGVISIGSLGIMSLAALWKAVGSGKSPITITPINDNPAKNRK